MKISVIIPNFNGKHLLEANFASVLNAVDYFLLKGSDQAEIIIVDDGSTDASVSYIKTHLLKRSDNSVAIRLVERAKNEGFAPSVNEGVHKSRGEFIVLINTDVIPQKDFLLPLLGRFEDENVFSVACMDKSIEHGEPVLRGRGVGKWERGFLIHAAGKLDKENTLWVSGGSSAFRKSLWDRLGGLDQLYNPFYWEDIDLSYRALKSGYRVLFEHKSIVVHEHEKGAIRKQYSPFEIKAIAYRNQCIFVWKNITDVDFLLQHIAWLPYYFLRALIKADEAFFLGFSQALVRFSKILHSRFEAKKHFIKSDKEVLRDLGT